MDASWPIHAMYRKKPEQCCRIPLHKKHRNNSPSIIIYNNYKRDGMAVSIASLCLVLAEEDEERVVIDMR